MSEHRSEAVRLAAIQYGWEAVVQTTFEIFDSTQDINDIMWHLYAKRDLETLRLSWRGDRYENGLYVYGDYRLKVWWRTEAMKLIAGQPNKSKFRSNGKVSLTEEEKEQSRKVPWKDDTPAFDIMLAVINKKVEWTRKIDGVIQEARVDVNLKEPASAKGFRVYVAKSGRRILEWVDSVGFHSVGLDQIISVE